MYGWREGRGSLSSEERDKANVNAAIRKVLFEIETAAQLPPDTACHPYMAEARRKAVVRTFWQLFRQLRTGE